MADHPHDLSSAELRSLGDRLAQVPADDKARARVLRGVQDRTRKRDDRNRQLRASLVVVVVLALASPALARLAARYELTRPLVTRLFGTPSSPRSSKVKRGTATATHQALADNQAVPAEPVVPLTPQLAPVPVAILPVKPPPRRPTASSSKVGVAPNHLVVPAKRERSEGSRVHSLEPTRFEEPNRPPSAENARSHLREQLESYRSALATKDQDPNGALGALRALRKKHPETPLLHELDIHILELLTTTKQWMQARTEALEFVRKHPQSPHLTHVRALLEHPDAR